jgi:hypothetical protein
LITARPYRARLGSGRCRRGARTLARGGTCQRHREPGFPHRDKIRCGSTPGAPPLNPVQQKEPVGRENMRDRRVASLSRLRRTLLRARLRECTARVGCPVNAWLPFQFRAAAASTARHTRRYSKRYNTRQTQRVGHDGRQTRNRTDDHSAHSPQGLTRPQGN